MKLHGFTLIELMIVLMIMSTMVAIIVPYATRSNKNLSIKQEVLSLELAIKYIMDLAIDKQLPTRIVLDRKINSFTLEIANSKNNRNFQPIEKLSDIGNHYFNKGIHILNFDGFEIEGNSYYLVFDPSKSWPSESVSLSINDLISTINIKGKRIEIRNEEI